MYANVCALSLFLTCGPYARLPAWAGENSPECLILLNKRHEEACQVLHGPCQSLLASLFSVSCSAPASALIRRRKWNVAAAASCCGSILLFFGLVFFFFQVVVFTALLAASRHWWHCTVSANRGQECYTAWTKRTSTTATFTPPQSHPHRKYTLTNWALFEILQLCVFCFSFQETWVSCFVCRRISLTGKQFIRSTNDVLSLKNQVNWVKTTDCVYKLDTSAFVTVWSLGIRISAAVMLVHKSSITLNFTKTGAQTFWLLKAHSSHIIGQIMSLKILRNPTIKTGEL